MNGKTVRVRIAVAAWIDPKTGQPRFSANGWDDASDRQMHESVVDCLPVEDGVERVSFVEADVPLPAPLTVEGTVAAGKE